MRPRLPWGLSERLECIAAAPFLLVCSDYDGTLAPLAPRPEQARLLDGALDLLHELAGLPDTRVAIVSGRPADNLHAHSALSAPVLLIGSHGAELPSHEEADRVADHAQQLDALEACLSRMCARAPGSWIERKPMGLALHVRQACAEDAARALAEARYEAANWPGLHVTAGKAVLDLSLARANKGDAVRWLRAHWGRVPAVLYLGDDITDEDAFAALEPGDVGIKIGAGPTLAGHRLDSEREALCALALIHTRRSAIFQDRDDGKTTRGSGG